jgi:hypothetical protein
VSGGLQKPVVVIIPKSKDPFMERPPIKIVQPYPIWVRSGVVYGRTWFGVSIGGAD